jgi:hypothetical protein
MLISLLLAACSGGEMFLEREFIETGFSCSSEMDAPLRDGFEASLTPDGCRYQIQALDTDGFQRLTLDVPAFAEAFAGAPVSTTYTLPDSTVRLEATAGCALNLGVCTDSAAEPIIVRTYTPTAGTVAVNITEEGGSLLADVTFTGVTLVNEYDEEVTISALTWTDVRLYGG